MADGCVIIAMFEYGTNRMFGYYTGIGGKRVDICLAIDFTQYELMRAGIARDDTEFIALVDSGIQKDPEEDAEEEEEDAVPREAPSAKQWGRAALEEEQGAGGVPIITLTNMEQKQIRPAIREFAEMCAVLERPPKMHLAMAEFTDAGLSIEFASAEMAAGNALPTLALLMTELEFMSENPGDIRGVIIPVHPDIDRRIDTKADAAADNSTQA